METQRPVGAHYLENHKVAGEPTYPTYVLMLVVDTKGPEQKIHPNSTDADLPPRWVWEVVERR